MAREGKNEGIYRDKRYGINTRELRSSGCRSWSVEMERGLMSSDFFPKRPNSSALVPIF